MPFVEKRLISPTSLTTSASTALYTVPTGYTAIVKQIVVTNTTGTAATFTMYIGAASAGNALFSGTSVAANDTVIINLSQVLGTGEILRALSGTNAALNLTVSGVENDGPLAQNAMYIADNAITTAKVADGAITTAKIADGAIVTIDIANTAVTSSKLADSLSLTGTPTAPTANAATNTTQIATTAFVTTADNLKANIASPTFTGTPLSTTAAVDTNTTQIATTAYVVGQGYAKLASPALSGTPTAPTAGAGTNTTQLATTAFANQAGGLVLISNTAVGSGVSSVTVSGCFSSTYDTYKVIYTGGTLSAGGTQTQLRLGATTSGYSTNLVYQVWGSGTVLGAATSGSSWAWIGGEKRGIGGGPCVVSFELTNPFVATYTMMNSNMYGADTTGGTTVGRLDNTASYTAFTLLPDAGTFSGGNVYVYGYRK